MLIITGATLMGIGAAVLAVFAPNVLTSVFSRITGYETIQSRPVQGDPANYDPIAAYASLQAFAGEGAQLISLDAQFVRADGTLDLTASYNPAPRVNAEFALEVAPPENAPPIGAGGLGTWYRRVSIHAYRPGQQGRVSSTGAGGSVTYTYVNEGMTRDIDDPATGTFTFLPTPTCAFADLWQVALERGAPANAVASIEYDDEGYDFRIRDVNFRLRFDNTCQVKD
ncbi:MAG: hypothetical protein AB4911_09730 [Oscillochloridaceae bacterium umkhey_bin13]